MLIIVKNGYYQLQYEDGIANISRSELRDFVDTDTKVKCEDGELLDINDYLGESECFYARVQNSDYNPF